MTVKKTQNAQFLSQIQNAEKPNANAIMNSTIFQRNVVDARKNLNKS